MQLLQVALGATVGTLPDGTTLNADHNNTSLAYLFLKHLQSLQAKAFPSCEKKALRVGGPISSILKLLRVPISDDECHPPVPMNFEYLRKFRVIEPKEHNGKLIYKFPHPVLGSARIPIPCTRFSSLKKPINIAFLPPADFLLASNGTASRPAPPASDIPVPPHREIPSAKPIKARKASSRSPTSDDDFDPLAVLPPPYDLKRLTSNMKEAHGRLNVLTTVNRWLVKGWKGMTSRESEARKREDEMARRIQALESQLVLNPRDPPVVERRRSVSGDRRAALQSDITHAPPRRSAAGAELGHRPRRRRANTIEDPFDNNDEAAHLFED